MTYVVQREDDLDFRSAEYADLHRAAGAPPFQHGVWLDRLYATLAPARGARPVVVTAREDGTGALALVLPLVRTGRLVRTVAAADLGVADYNAPVCSRAFLDELRGDPAVADAVRGGVRRALGRFDLLAVDRVAGAADDVLALLRGAQARRHHYDTHVVELAGTAEAWRKSLDASFVRHLERKYKRLRPRGERVLREVTDVAEVEPLLQRMREFRRARFADRRAVDLVQDDDAFAFYCAVAAESIRHGGPGRLVALEVGGEPVAIAFDLVAPERELFLLVGYDVERLRNYSLGLLVVDELIRAAIERGRSSFDLTVGDEPYKADFGAHAVALHQVRVPRTLRGRLAMHGRDAWLASRQLTKRRLADWHRLRARLEPRFRAASAQVRRWWPSDG